MKKTIELEKYFQVRLYPNSTFKIVETNDFHESKMVDIFSHYNSYTKESYHYLICIEKNIEKSKRKIANYFLKDAKIELASSTKKVALFTKLLNSVKL